ncbi:MAG TPA: hypothetical protein VL326_17620 [Kofleriaceae bacterium]|nr:hypothetical protein [Kofleriaceae bacterium]
MSKRPLAIAVAALLGAASCTGGAPDSSPTGGGDDGTTTGSDPGTGSDTGSGSAGSGSGSDTGMGSGSPDIWQTQLNARTYNYPAALRTAALRLTGDLPTVAQIEQLANAADPKAVYGQLINAMLTDPRFTRQMLGFWRDTFKMGGAADLDTAPAFAAQLTVNNGSSDQLFLATTGTCPTVANDVITSASCTNNPPATAGVLTNPGAMKQFAGNLAFRRVRWVQEVFDCTAFPAEVGTPKPVGANNAPYTAPWDFASIAGTDNGGRVNFHDTSAVVCANCHATMNHLAPLFANFDANGLYTTAIAVTLPTDGRPLATRADWLPAGETTAWRYNKPATTLTQLGQAMAADPQVGTCTVARVWNFALGKGDIVQTLSIVPADVIQTQLAAFDASGHKLRDLFYTVFTSDDFTKY